MTAWYRAVGRWLRNTDLRKMKLAKNNSMFLTSVFNIICNQKLKILSYTSITSGTHNHLFTQGCPLQPKYLHTNCCMTPTHEEKSHTHTNAHMLSHACSKHIRIAGHMNIILHKVPKSTHTSEMAFFTFSEMRRDK
jgi:hypothetical protein